MARNNSVFIGGIAGMVGSVLSRHFIEQGYKVFGADNFLTSSVRNLDPRVQFWEINLCDSEAVRQIFNAVKPTYVINLAAEASEILSPFIRKFSYQNNLISHANILNECVNHNVEKAIVFSSIGVYGHLIPPFREDMEPKPADPYSLGKHFIELDTKIVSEHFGLNYSIIRPFNLFCKYQQYNNLYRNAIAIWIRQSILKQPLTIYGDGLQKRSFSSCSCLCEPIQQLLTKFPREIFNIGSENPITILEACQTVKKTAQSFGFNPDIVHLEPRKEVKLAWCDLTKAKTLLGFKDNTDLEKLIYEMFAYALEHILEIEEPKKMHYEIEKGLYSYWK